MPDLEAIEVAQSDLSDVSDSESSEVALGDEVIEQPEDKAATETADPEGEANEKESKSQRRRRLRRDKEEKTNERVRQLEDRNAQLEKRIKTLQPPDPSDYTSQAEYTADLAAYRVEERQARTESDDIQQGFEQAGTDDASSLSEAVSDIKAEGAEKYDDFLTVVNRTVEEGGPAISTIMTEAIIDSDIGADLAYYLGKNVKESQRIYALSPVSQARAIFELEGKVAKSNVPAKSKAPQPIKPVKGGSAAPTKPVSQMSMSEYAAHRQKQINGEQ